jgi:glycosyltransferase involved in cell wall biosynthesis
MSLRRIHVLHVSATTGGGIASLATGYVRDQVERGWNVSVACPSYGELGFAARGLGAEVSWWDAGRRRGVLDQAARLRRVVAATRPDVVHLHGGTAGVIGRLVVRDRLPTVYQPHGSPAPGAGRRARVRWELYAQRWTTELVVTSTDEREQYAELGVTSTSTVLPRGVDLTRFRPASPRDRTAARKELGLEDVPTAITVGDLTRRKGHQELVTHWPHVRRRVPEAALLMVGTGPEHAALQRLATDGVHLVGARTDVPLWLAAADVVVVPSRWEATGLVPLEAMASARSVVVSDVGAMSEVVPPDAGAVVAPGDGPGLVDAVVRRLRSPDLADEEGWLGRANVETHHDLFASARELTRVYLRLVAARRGR